MAEVEVKFTYKHTVCAAWISTAKHAIHTPTKNIVESNTQYDTFL